MFANSRDVADFFGKLHKDVLRAIDRLDCSEKFRSLNFEESFLGVETGRGAHRIFRAFDMTKDGFAFLAMGFTGREVTRVRKGIPTRNKDNEALSVRYGLTCDLSDDIPIKSLTLSDKRSRTMKIAYARVSSTGQNEAAQVDILNRHGAEEIFIEKASGTSRDGRPKLAEAIKFARKGDVLMVTRLDRLARSVSDLHAIAKELQAKDVDLVVTEQNIDTTTPTGRLMFNMLGAIAEFETDLRKERQLEGIAKAKAEGRYKGRPVTVDGDAIRAALAAGDKPSVVAKRFNVARSTVYRVMAEAA